MTTIDLRKTQKKSEGSMLRELIVSQAVKKSKNKLYRSYGLVMSLQSSTKRLAEISYVKYKIKKMINASNSDQRRSTSSNLCEETFHPLFRTWKSLSKISISFLAIKTSANVISQANKTKTKICKGQKLVIVITTGRHAITWAN